jgi:tRNA pseudouridine55 synthase
VEHITRQSIEAAVQNFVGHIHQTPPAFSACKVQGKRAYDLARAGKEAALEAKPIHIEDIRVLDFVLVGEGVDAPLLQLYVRCGKGTYIRSLARDLGEALGSGAYLTELRRTRVGEVSVDDCLTLDGLQQWIDQTLPQ